MFNSFSKLKISTKVVMGILIVEFISLASGITMGKNITSHWVILGCLSTVVLSQYIAWVVAEDVKKSVKNVLGNLSETSSNLNSLSKEMTEVGHRLAQGSTEQAASIQETSSTLEESSSMVHQTTQNTKQAEVLAKQTKDGAEKGNVDMQVMLSSMEELKRSSGEISKIIKVIDEIAFQTNILSLNAAVEAARAGDAGKGFAVVAEEVRNLAQRSAQAAKDTAVIIESNIDLSERCLGVTQQVNSSLSAITEDTRKVSELLEEISTASQEQEIGIVQINQAISQMERVLQDNAATAQESANSADELSLHSDTIKTIMTELKYIIDGYSQAKADYSVASKETFVSEKMPKMPKAKASKKTSEAKEPKSQLKIQKQEKKSAPSNAAKSVGATKPEDVIPLGDF